MAESTAEVGERSDFPRFLVTHRSTILRFAPMAESFLNYYLDFFDSVLVYSIILTQTSTTHHTVSYRS